MRKRLLAMLMALCLCLSMLPGAALAAEDTAEAALAEAESAVAEPVDEAPIGDETPADEAPAEDIPAVEVEPGADDDLTADEVPAADEADADAASPALEVEERSVDLNGDELEPIVVIMTIGEDEHQQYTYYSSLQAAVNYVTTTSHPYDYCPWIIVQKDITLSETVTINTSLCLYMDGVTISADEDAELKYLVEQTGGYLDIRMYTSGMINTKGGIVRASVTDESNLILDDYYNDCSFTALGTAVYATGPVGVYVNGVSYTSTSGYALMADGNASVYVNNGTFTAPGCAVAVTGGASLTIEDGTFTANTPVYAFSSVSSLTIEGGTFAGESCALYVSGCADFSVTGGRFSGGTGASYVADVVVDKTGYYITGGDLAHGTVSFDGMNATAMTEGNVLAPGYKCVEGDSTGDYNYSVQKAADSELVAELGYWSPTDKFLSLQNAVDAAKNRTSGDISIKLLKDVTLADGETVTFSDELDYSLDLAGHTITGNVATDGLLRPMAGSLTITDSSSASTGAVTNTNSGGTYPCHAIYACPKTNGKRVTLRIEGGSYTSVGDTIDAYGATITITDGVFTASGTGSRAVGLQTGSALSVYGGAFAGAKILSLSADSTAVFRGGRFSTNTIAANNEQKTLGDTDLNLIASGYTVGTNPGDDSADYPYAVLPANVAQVGDTTYTSLQAAIDAAPDNTATTVTLLSDLDLGESVILIPGKKIITLDMQSHTLSSCLVGEYDVSAYSRYVTYHPRMVSEHLATISVFGELTITGGGTVVGNDSYGALFVSGAWSIAYAAAKLTVENGTFTGTAGQRALCIDGSNRGAEVVIHGGAFSAGDYAAVVEQYNGNLTIHGGSFCGAIPLLYDGGELAVDGGCFVHSSTKWTSDILVVPDETTGIVLTGGYFSANTISFAIWDENEEDDDYYDYDSYVEYLVKSSYVSQKTEPMSTTNVLAACYVCQPDTTQSDCAYAVRYDTTAVAILTTPDGTTTHYSTLADAVAAAPTNAAEAGTIRLLKDISLDTTPVTIEDGRMLCLEPDGHAITGNVEGALLQVTGGHLTIRGSGSVVNSGGAQQGIASSYDTPLGGGDSSSCAVSVAAGSSLTVEGSIVFNSSTSGSAAAYAVRVSGGTLTIGGGEFYGAQNVLYLSNAAAATVSGGSFRTLSSGAAVAGEASTKYDIYLADTASVVSVSGGKFSSNTYYNGSAAAAMSDANILDRCYVCVANTDSDAASYPYVVKAGTPQAYINGSETGYYLTLQEAINALQDSENDPAGLKTIILESDVALAEGESITIPANITVRLELDNRHITTNSSTTDTVPALVVQGTLTLTDWHNGGVASSRAAEAIQLCAGGALTVTGGTVSASGTGAICALGGTLSVSGGFFAGGGDASPLRVTCDTKVSLTGGLYAKNTVDRNTADAADTYTAIEMTVNNSLLATGYECAASGKTDYLYKVRSLNKYQGAVIFTYTPADTASASCITGLAGEFTISSVTCVDEVVTVTLEMANSYFPMGEGTTSYAGTVTVNGKTPTSALVTGTNDALLTITFPEPAVKISAVSETDTYYDTLAAAFTAASAIEGDYNLTLLRDLSLTESVTLTVGDRTVELDGEYTVTGSASDAVVTIHADNGSRVSVEHSVTIVNTNESAGCALRVCGEGTFELRGNYTAHDAALDIDGCEVEIYGGTYTGAAAAVRVRNGGQLSNPYSDTFVSTEGYALQLIGDGETPSAATIKNGAFTGGTGAVITSGNAELTIQDGFFDGGDADLYVANTALVTVTGGQFTRNTAACLNGYGEYEDTAMTAGNILTYGYRCVANTDTDTKAAYPYQVRQQQTYSEDITLVWDDADTAVRCDDLTASAVLADEEESEYSVTLSKDGYVFDKTELFAYTGNVSFAEGTTPALRILSSGIDVDTGSLVVRFVRVGSEKLTLTYVPMGTVVDGLSGLPAGYELESLTKDGLGLMLTAVVTRPYTVFANSTDESSPTAYAGAVSVNGAEVSATVSADGKTLTITFPDPVARIRSTYYSTLEDALAAAEWLDTIVLLHEVNAAELSETTLTAANAITIPDGVTVDARKYALTNLTTLSFLGTGKLRSASCPATVNIPTDDTDATLGTRYAALYEYTGNFYAVSCYERPYVCYVHYTPGEDSVKYRDLWAAMKDIKSDKRNLEDTSENGSNPVDINLMNDYDAVAVNDSWAVSESGWVLKVPENYNIRLFLNGNNLTISSKNGIWTMSNSRLTIQGSTDKVIEWTRSDDGELIRNYGITTIKDCALVGTVSSTGAGTTGIANEGSSLTLDKVTFRSFGKVMNNNNANTIVRDVTVTEGYIQVNEPLTLQGTVNAYLLLNNNKGMLNFDVDSADTAQKPLSADSVISFRVTDDSNNKKFRVFTTNFASLSNAETLKGVFLPDADYYGTDARVIFASEDSSETNYHELTLTEEALPVYAIEAYSFGVTGEGESQTIATNISYLTGGGAVYEGDTTFLSAPDLVAIADTEGDGTTYYAFTGWYAVTDKTALSTRAGYGETAVSTAPTLAVKADADTAYAAGYEAQSAAPTYTATLVVNNSTDLVKVYSVGNDETLIDPDTDASTENKQVYNIPYGTRVKLVSKTDGVMTGWVNERNLLVCAEDSYEFVLLTRTELTADIRSTGVVVRVVNDSGQVMKKTTITEAISALSDVLPATPPVRTGYTATGEYALAGSTTALTVEAFNEAYTAAAADGGTGLITLRPLYTRMDTSYTITVRYAGIARSGSSQQALYGATCELTAAEAPEGKQFAYWTDADGNVVSYQQSYTVYVACDAVYVATYVPTGKTVTVSPAVSLQVLAEGTNKLKLIVTRDVPESTGYSVIESGIVFSTTNTNPVLGGEGVKVRTGTLTNRTGMYIYNLGVGTRTDTTVTLRGYVLLEDSAGRQLTVYTPLWSGSYNSLTGN